MEPGQLEAILTAAQARQRQGAWEVPEGRWLTLHVARGLVAVMIERVVAVRVARPLVYAHGEKGAVTAVEEAALLGVTVARDGDSQVRVTIGAPKSARRPPGAPRATWALALGGAVAAAVIAAGFTLAGFWLGRGNPAAGPPAQGLSPTLTHPKPPGTPI